jgi:hypothetical protein
MQDKPNNPDAANEKRDELKAVTTELRQPKIDHGSDLSCSNRDQYSEQCKMQVNRHCLLIKAIPFIF